MVDINFSLVATAAEAEKVVAPIAANTGDLYTYTSISYEEARNGTDGLEKYNGVYIGQSVYGSDWEVDQSFIAFAPFQVMPTKVFLKLVGYVYAAAQPWTLEIRKYDYGETLELADWVPGNNLGNYTLLASVYLDTDGQRTLEIELDPTEDLTHLLLCSDRQRLGQAPTEDVDEYCNFSVRNLIAYGLPPEAPPAGNFNLSLLAISGDTPAIIEPTKYTPGLSPGAIEAIPWCSYSGEATFFPQAMCMVCEDSPDTKNYTIVGGNNFRSSTGNRSRYIFYVEIPETCNDFRVGVHHWGSIPADFHMQAFDVTQHFYHSSIEGPTWNSRSSIHDLPWDAPGGDLGELLGEAFGPVPDNYPVSLDTYLYIDLTSYAQSWLDCINRVTAVPICLLNAGPTDQSVELRVMVNGQNVAS